MFQQGNTYGNGRPLGAKNKAPKREDLINLLDAIVNDLTIDYDTLTKDDKINLLRVFRHLYAGLRIENSIEEHGDIRVTIVNPNTIP